MFWFCEQKGAPTPGADLEDMQSFFYMLEDGDAQNRAGRLNLALKRYYTAFKVQDTSFGLGLS